MSEKDEVLQILSGSIDLGSGAYGGMISVKQFDKLADTLIAHFDQPKDKFKGSPIHNKAAIIDMLDEFTPAQMVDTVNQLMIIEANGD